MPDPPSFESFYDEIAWGRKWQAKLAADRWVGIHWPSEFGGRDASPVQVAIYNLEYGRSRALQLVNRTGINLAGPTLLAHGTEEQKAQWLPSILDADEIWCQLFSEPEAGSDLAALRTVAEVDGEDLVVTDQKIVRLMECLFRDPDIMVVVANPTNARMLNEAARKQGGRLSVLVDLDPGMGRTGVSFREGLALGQWIHSLPAMRLRGIQCYAGNVQHILSFQERSLAAPTATRT